MNIEEIIEGYLGNTQVNSIYQGSELVWPDYSGDKYMICGTFDTYSLNDKSFTKNKIIRLNNDDSIDNTWKNNNSYTSVYKLKYDNINRKVYAAGYPSLDGGLIRFNLDGTKDISFNIGVGFDNHVEAIEIDTINQKIYVGGNFKTFQGSTQNYLVRLNMDGSLDSSFNIFSGFNNTVWNLILFNNKLYVGGNFTKFRGSTQNRLVRLNTDGSLDNTFNVGTGFDSTVNTINIDTINQKLYVGGYFTTYNYGMRNRIVRLNMDGSVNGTFNVGTGFNGSVEVIKIDTINQKIYVAGYFTTYNGSTQNRIVRLNMDGSKDSTFNIGTGLNSNSTAYDILIDNEKNKIYIVGNFTIYNGVMKNNIARLNTDGSLDNTFNIQLEPSINDPVNSSALTILKYRE